MKLSSFLFLATTAALGLAAPAANAGEFSLSFKEGPVEIFYHLGLNPSVEEFQNGKKQLEKMVRREVIRPSTTALPTQWGGRSGEPYSYPDVN